MLEKRTPLQLSQAVEKIMVHSIEGGTEEISINDCDGRYLGEDIIATNDVDMLITTGGVSVGDYDYMPEVYKALNGEVFFIFFNRYQYPLSLIG
jgi:molybdopterin biosynthesis enzyme